MPAVAAGAVLLVVLIAGVSGRSNGSTSTSTSGVPVATDVEPGETGLTVPSGTQPPVVIATDPAIPKTNLSSTVRKGSFGNDVKKVQQRLTDLGFAPGPVDGAFGSGTEQAVWAFEKLVLRTPRSEATGKVTNAMWQIMQDQLVISPRRPEGAGTTHMEIYVPEQVAIVFTDDKPVLITHISTGEQNPDGTPKTFCEEVPDVDTDDQGNPLAEPTKKGICAEAKTPGGVFRFGRMEQGHHVSVLGGMNNPAYFNYGIAVHGADNVPLEPASHGCVRINQTIATYFQTLIHKRDRVYVWAQDGKQPEQYTKDERLPSFNRRDPSYTTTTTSTTSTTSTTTTTTVKPTTTTTTVKPTTTTTSPTTTASPATTTTTTTTLAD